MKLLPAQGSGGAPYEEGTLEKGGWGYHEVVKIPLYPGRIFDPSYGSIAQAPTATYGSDAELIAAAELAWENDNVVDFFDETADEWVGINAAEKELDFDA